MITAITNQKGGVGKTTTAIALAHGLAMAGRTVVLVDMDAQGNAAAALGQRPAPGVARLFLAGTPIDELCIEIRPNFWLLPGDPQTARLKSEFQGAPADTLARALADLAVDHVIIDTGPSRDLLHDLIYHAADRLVIPTTLDFLGLVGVAQQFDSLRELTAGGRRLEVVGILPTFWDATTNESETNLRQLVETFGDLVVPAIPRTTKLREAPARGLTAWEMLPEKKLAGYQALSHRLLASSPAHPKA